MKTRLASIATFSVLALAGCSDDSSTSAGEISSSGSLASSSTMSNSDTSPSVSATEATPTPESTFASEGAPANSRNLLPKKIGEVASINGCSGGNCLTFAVTQIMSSPACPGTSKPPVRGEYLTVTMAVDTTAEFASNSEAASGNLSRPHWSYLTADGVTHKDVSGTPETANAQWCYPQPGFEGELNPSSKYTGQMAFDVPKNTTAVMLERPGGAKGNGPGGWEWTVPR